MYIGSPLQNGHSPSKDKEGQNDSNKDLLTHAPGLVALEAEECRDHGFGGEDMHQLG